MSQGPTSQGVTTLIGLDPGATWNTTTKTVQGGCMVTGTCLDDSGNAIALSARVVPLAIFNPASYVAGGYTGTNGVAQVENLLGFFVEGMCNDVYPNAATRPVVLRHAGRSQQVRGRQVDELSRPGFRLFRLGRTCHVPEDHTPRPMN